MTDPAATRIPLAQVIVGAFQLPWIHRADLARRAGVPLLACIGWSIFWGLVPLEATPVLRWICVLVYCLLTSWLALTVHRLVLLEDPGSALTFNGPALTRFARFFAAISLIWVTYQGLRVVLIGGLMTRFVRTSDPVEPLLPFFAADMVASAVSLLVIARLTLALPRIAVGQPVDLPEVWRITRGNSLRIAVIVGLLPWLFEQFASLLLREGASDLEWSLIQVCLTGMLVIEVVALSLAHRALTAPAPPPTDPRV